MTRFVPAPYRAICDSFESAGVSSGGATNLDPFLNLDLFRMRAPTFPPHPHAGFSAVTYMLPESKGGFINRDSLGSRTRIEPGALHWTQAGSGLLHEEIPELPGTECQGFQIFVDMDDKALAPRVFRLAASEVPVVGEPQKSCVRVLAGEYAGQASPLAGVATPVTMLDITLGPAETISLPRHEGWSAFVFSISGRASSAGAWASGPGIVLVDADERRIELRADAETPWRGLVCTGRPLAQPVVWGGPFAMRSREELVAARRRFEAGEMGRLSPSF